MAGLDLAVDEARVKLDFARQELARLERLLETGAIPARRVTETKSQEAFGGFDPERAFNLDEGVAPPERLFGWSGVFELVAGPVEIAVADCPAIAVTIVCLPAEAASGDALRALESRAEALFAGDLALTQPGERFVAGDPAWQLMAVEPNVSFWWDVEEPGGYAVFLEKPPNPTDLDLRSGGEALRPTAERRGTLAHAHEDDVSTVSIEEDAPLDGDAVAGWLTTLLRVQGEDLFRTKGILYVRGMKERFVIQAVHMVLDGGPDRPWAPDEPRKSRLVFIGRNLDRELLLAGFRSCVAEPEKEL